LLFEILFGSLRDLPLGVKILYTLISVLAILTALVVHEAAHAWAAYKLGDSFAKKEGRLSLNPVRHIDPAGGLLILLFGFGWAKPVRVNPYVFRDYKRDMALTAAAGPVSNFILAFFAVGCMRVISFMGAGIIVSYLNMFFWFLAIINIGLGIFNLVPIPPLDGSKILAAFLPDRIYETYMRFERHGMIILMAIILLGRFGTIGFFDFIGIIRGAVYDAMFGVFFGFGDA
jgi:Zn-dependent protease